VVDEQGTVGQVSVLAAEPEGVFEQSVLRCVAGWRFKPGTIGGVAVKALVEQTITFKLEERHATIDPPYLVLCAFRLCSCRRHRESCGASHSGTTGAG